MKNSVKIMQHLFNLRYFTLTIILFISYQTQAAPQYSNITDIVVAGTTTAAIDFNGDATAEFTLEDGSFGGNSEISTFFDPAKVNFVTKTATWDAFEAIPLGTTIDGNSGYNAAGDCYFNPFWASSVFPIGSDQYIGVQFDLNGNMHYGWVLVELNTNGEVTVKSYAYETTPNTGIAAGDTVSSTSILVSGITIQGQNGVSSILENSTLQMEATVLPANASNSSVFWAITNQTGTATIDSTTGLLSALTAGTVLVQATAKDGSAIAGTTVITIQQATHLATIASEQFKLYPNPIQDYFYLESQGVTQYQLFNLQGQEVQKGLVTKNKQKIACSLPKGLYMICISSAKEKSTQLINIH